MKLFYVLLSSMLCNNFLFATHEKTPLPPDITSYRTFLSHWDRDFLWDLHEAIAEKTATGDAHAVREINALKKGFVSIENCSASTLNGYLYLSYALVDELVGQSRAMNEALRGLCEAVMKACPLKTAVIMANNCTFYSAKPDALWPYFIPTLLAKHLDKSTNEVPLNCALRYLRRHVEELSQFGAIRNLDGMQKPGLWIKCWHRSLEAMIADHISFGITDLKELLSQLKLLLDYTEIPLHEQCEATFHVYRVALNNDLERYAKMLRTEGASESELGYKTKPFKATGESSIALYGYCKMMCLMGMREGTRLLATHLVNLSSAQKKQLGKEFDSLVVEVQRLGDDVDKRLNQIPSRPIGNTVVFLLAPGSMPVEGEFDKKAIKVKVY